MKKQIFLFSVLVLLAIAIVSSCQKDPDPNNNNQNNEQPTDTIPIVTDGIRFGDTTGMIVTAYNTIMEFDEQWHPFVLDLNGGGVDDIKIETVYDGPMMTNSQELTLYCLNDHTELLGEIVEKESFTSTETSYETGLSWDDDTTMIVMAITSTVYSTCEKITENDQVHISNVFEVTANDYDDVFSKDDNFQSKNITLFRQDVSYGTTMEYITADTIFFSSQDYIFHCWNFPTDVEKYIGFRITQHGNSRYGWLKLKLHSTWSSKVVDTELIETAIQK